MAASIRRDLGLARPSPLPPESLAEYLGIRLLTPRDVTGLSPNAVNILLGRERDNWSAVTVTHAGKDALIYNPAHSPARQASDVMHELSHLFLGHTPSQIILSQDRTFAIKSFDGPQEEEAGWLAGCLLLPRDALVSIHRAGLSQTEACEEYGVSEALLNWRIKTTGINRQFGQR